MAGDEGLGDEADVLGAGFADLKIPEGTLAMIGNLKRAKALRRRSNRQSELLEITVSDWEGGRAGVGAGRVVSLLDGVAVVDRVCEDVFFCP